MTGSHVPQVDALEQHHLRPCTCDLWTRSECEGRAGIVVIDTELFQMVGAEAMARVWMACLPGRGILDQVVCVCVYEHEYRDSYYV